MSIRVKNSAAGDDQFLAAHQPGGAGTDNYQDIVLCDSAGNVIATATSAPAGTERGLITRPIGPLGVQGGTLVTSSGNITTATTAIASGDIGVYNNVTVVISGTYAGVNAIFEVSPDAGTTWVPIIGAKLDGSGTESTTGVLPANTTRGWEFTLPAVNRFRVRSTAFTSGSAAVIIAAGTMPLEPVVNAITSKPSSFVACDFGTVVGGVTGVTTEALLSLTPVRDGVAGTAGTAFSPTAGKTFKATALSIAVQNGAATQNGLRVYLRINPSGTATATSPIHAMVGISAPNAVSGGMTGINIPLDIDIRPGWSFGLTQIAAIASGSMHAHLIGYEY